MSTNEPGTTLAQDVRDAIASAIPPDRDDEGLDDGKLLDRIRARVAFSPTGCWVWQGGKNNRGYGLMNVQINRKIITKSVHRLVAAIAHGPIPEGMMALHTCDVRACVNPAHLYIGTAKDNANDRESRGRSVNPTAAYNRSKTHCPSGHPYNQENTYFYPRTNSRACRICKAVLQRRDRVAKQAVKREEAA